MSLSTPELARLDAAYRTAQASVMTATGTAVFRMYRTMTLDDLTTAESDVLEQFLRRSTQIILAGNKRTEVNADAFYQVIRRGQIGTVNVPAVDFEPPSVEQIRTSLYVTGVVGLQQRLKKIPSAPPAIRPTPPVEGEDAPLGASLRERQFELLATGRQSQIRDALNSAGMAAVGASVRHAGNGGREKIRAIAKADPKATGYARVTRANCCFYCAMLASRGAVYKKDSFDASDARFEGAGTAKVHDTCQCGMRPMFTENENEWPEFNQEQRARWESDEMSDQLAEGVDAMLAWRRLYEGRIQT